ncbi:MAG: hypothetical protein PHE15_05285 [Dehalococcoidales bacterium]|jgi:Na+-transporting methylmalonyl-CoA/oxaloacetate decarboxylase gamma subunit|nr:hypothetical protein [Dehalococcoidales bacterium]
MKLGLLELGIVFAILLILFGVSRFSKMGQNANTQQRRYDPEEESAIRDRRIALRATREEEDERIKQLRSARGRMLGYILVGVGILAIFYMLFIVHWVFTSSIWLWGIVIVAIGLVTLYLSRRS